MASVHGDIRPETAGELQAVFARRGREHSRGAQLGELYGQTSHTASCTVDDDGLAFFQMQCVVDTLERGESGRRNCAGVLEIVDDFDGNTFDVARLRGRKLLLLAWASW